MAGAGEHEAKPRYGDVDGGKRNGAEEITEKGTETGSRLEDGTMEAETPERGRGVTGEGTSVGMMVEQWRL